MQFSYTEFCTCIELSVNLSIFVYIWVFIYVLTVNEITRSIVHLILKYFKDQRFTSRLACSERICVLMRPVVRDVVGLLRGNIEGTEFGLSLALLR